MLPRYLDGLLEGVPWGDYAVVGFTTTFQQTVPSVALARRLKARHPAIVTVFGGAGCEPDMGLELVSTEVARAWSGPAHLWFALRSQASP